MVAEATRPEPEPPPAPPEDHGLRWLTRAAWLLVALGLVALLYAARDFFIPLVLGITLTYMLRPAVDALVRLRLPRMLAALVVVLASLGALGYGAYELRDDAARLIETLPKAARMVRLAVQEGMRSNTPGAITNVRQAARELDHAAAAASGQPATRASSPSSTITARLESYLVAQGVSLFGIVVQVLFATLLTWYLLSEGDTFKRKMMRLVGPELHRRRITVRILDDIDHQVQRQVLAMFVANTLIGLATATAFWAMGIESAALWGVIAGVLHFIPYVGQAIVTTASAAAAFFQFGEVGPALGAAALTLALSITIGTVLVNWLLSRACHVNTTLLFVAMLFFAWLWGAWGLVLAAPMMAMVKSVCDHVEAFAPAAQFLAGHESDTQPFSARPREASGA